MLGLVSYSDVGSLIRKGRYQKAIKVLRRGLEERPGDLHLRQRLVDVLSLDGKQDEALEILEDLAKEFAQAGFDAKALAMVKKMDRIAPGSADGDHRVAELIRERSEPRVFFALPGDASNNAPKSAARELLTFNAMPLFESMTSEQLFAVLRGLTLTSYEPGEVVFSEGEEGDRLYVVASGAVRVYVRDLEGRNQQVRVIEQGDFFGEISLLEHTPRSATLIAADHCELLELDRRTLADLVVDFPGVPKLIEEAAARRIESREELDARGAAG